MNAPRLTAPPPVDEGPVTLPEAARRLKIGRSQAERLLAESGGPSGPRVGLTRTLTAADVESMRRLLWNERRMSGDFDRFMEERS